jgi:hypothetical protein
MDATAWVCIATAGVAAAAAGLAVVAARVISRASRELAASIARLEEGAEATVRQAYALSAHAGEELERVDEVLKSASAVTSAVGSASRVAERVFTNPIVKMAAFGTGFSSATKRLLTGAPTPRGNGSLSRVGAAPRRTSRFSAPERPQASALPDGRLTRGSLRKGSLRK